MRCAATVQNPWVLTYRARTDCSSPQCRREAKVGTLCRQHATVRDCQARGCDRRGVLKEGEWWFCRKHQPLWAEHNRIVQRILEIPVRP